jgi:2Fe-2S ferredoxin
VEQGADALAEISDKEEDFVDRARSPKYNSRLACQCVLLQDQDLVVTVPDQSLIIGH